MATLAVSRITQLHGIVGNAVYTLGIDEEYTCGRPQTTAEISASSIICGG